MPLLSLLVWCMSRLRAGQFPAPNAVVPWVGAVAVQGSVSCVLDAVLARRHVAFVPSAGALHAVHVRDLDSGHAQPCDLALDDLLRPRLWIEVGRLARGDLLRRWLWIEVGRSSASPRHCADDERDGGDHEDRADHPLQRDVLHEVDAASRSQYESSALAMPRRHDGSLERHATRTPWTGFTSPARTARWSQCLCESARTHRGTHATSKPGAPDTP
jgi:hypothetical protein